MQPKADRPDDGRAQALVLLNDHTLSLKVIARRLGVTRQRVTRWNARAGIRLPQPRRRTLDDWPQGRRESAMRLLAAADADPADLAEVAGFARAGGPTILAAFGPGDRRPREGGAVEPHHLRKRLQAHIGRQIAVLDAALSTAPQAGFDSAKVLRDLGGLKRLLDDLGDGHDRDREGEPRDEPARSDPEAAALDLDGVRAEIARRFDRFVGGGTAG